MKTKMSAVSLPGRMASSGGHKAGAGIVLLATFLWLLSMPFISGGHAVAAAKKYTRSVEDYALPDVVLVNQNGQKVRLKSLLSSDRPVVVDFIYGTCTTICPVLSAGYANLQKTLGADSTKVHLVSISIDPENDTPKVMKEYLKRYRARPGWDFLTGTRGDVDRVMKSFNAYVYNKMSHTLLTLIRLPKGGKWIRISGPMSTAELMEECAGAGMK